MLAHPVAVDQVERGARPVGKDLEDDLAVVGADALLVQCLDVSGNDPGQACQRQVRCGRRAVGLDGQGGVGRLSREHRVAQQTLLQRPGVERRQGCARGDERREQHEGSGLCPAVPDGSPHVDVPPRTSPALR